MNRIDLKFQELRAAKRKAFIAYIMAGDPSLQITEELIPALAEAGADIIELGVPFSDPMADGLVIQEAAYRSLRGGTTLTKILSMVRRVRTRTEVPIAIMSYYNPVQAWGDAAFVAQAKAAGVDGIIIPDLPVEESGDLRAAGKTHDLGTIFFLAPTTAQQRVEGIVRAATGFIYFVSLTGVTGVRKDISSTIAAQVKKARSMTKTPVCVGFGISTPEQVRDVAGFADGVIIGSAIIREIWRQPSDGRMVERAAAFVKKLSRPLHV